MFSKTQFILFYAIFVAVMLFFESSIMTWVSAKNIEYNTTFYTSNSSHFQDSNSLNDKTDSSCFYTISYSGLPDVWNWGRQITYLDCTNSTCRSYSSGYCISTDSCNQITSLSCVVSSEPNKSLFTGIFSMITLGTNDPNLAWFNAILLVPLTIAVAYAIITSAPTFNGGA